MPSPKLTKEQADLQKIRLAEEVERRKALGLAGKQKSLTAKVKELLPSALNNIKAVVEGEPLVKKTEWKGTAKQEADLKGALGDKIEFVKEGNVWYRIDYYHVDKTQYDASKWVVGNAIQLEKHQHELKKLRLSAKEAEAKANAGGYGDKTPAKVKEEFEQKGLTSVTGGKFSMDLDEDFDEYVEEDEDE